MIGGIIGGIIGILGGLAGTYCSVRNTKTPAERRFVIRMAVMCWAGITLFLLALFLLPVSIRWVLWTVYPLFLIPWIIYMNRRQAELRREAGDDPRRD